MRAKGHTRWFNEHSKNEPNKQRKGSTKESKRYERKGRKDRGWITLVWRHTSRPVRIVWPYQDSSFSSSKRSSWVHRNTHQITSIIVDAFRLWECAIVTSSYCQGNVLFRTVPRLIVHVKVQLYRQSKRQKVIR